jgi:hypothetical protein
MNKIDTAEKKEIREFFCKNWMTHDGLWFALTVDEIGIEKTNTINTNGIRMMAEIEIKRLMKMFNSGNESFNSYTEFKKFISNAIDFVRPDFMKFDYSFNESSVLQIDLKTCWAYEGVKKLGFIEQYECAVIVRLKSWFDYLKIGYSVSPEFKNCLMHENGLCSYRFIFPDIGTSLNR